MNELGVETPTAPPQEGLLQRLQAQRVWLWPLWLLAFGLWTAALLTTLPAEISHDKFSAHVGFSLAKLLHVSTYATLAAMGLLLPLPAGWRWAPIGVLSLHGFVTEYLQQFIPLRNGCWQDVVIDHVGIAIGVAAVWWLERRLKVRDLHDRA